MKNCRLFEEITKLFIPDIFEEIDWNGIWGKKPESGTAFEWTTFAAMIEVARENGIEVSFPLLEEYNAGEFFLLRNEIPRSYGAQAGNSASLLSSKSLSDRFFYCLVPKAILKLKDATLSVFREGCPYHKIMSGKNYLERTDIMFLPGNPSSTYPQFNPSRNEVLFSYEYPNQTINGRIRILNSPIIPCVSRFPREGIQLIPKGIIECSVNKTAVVATEQLQKYNEIFIHSFEKNKFSLVTGNDLSCLGYDAHTINIASSDISILYDNFITAAEQILRHFSIIVQ